jgi:hypothetical protein
MPGGEIIQETETQEQSAQQPTADGKAAQASEVQVTEAIAEGAGTEEEFDDEKLLTDLRELQKNYEGLRKKLAAAEKSQPVTAEDLAEELEGIEGEEDKKFAGKFVEILARSGVDKKAAKDLLKNMGELYQPEDPKEFFRKEMEKLGKDGKELIGELRQFRDAMKQQSDWAPEDFEAMDAITQTADGVKLMSKVLRSAKQMKAGQFSTYAPERESAEDLSNRDRIGMYERAFSLQQTDPEKARQELNRLARMFEH